MKKNYQAKRAIALVCALTAGLSTFAGCKKHEDSEDVLEVLCWEAGYGTDWCEAMLDAFEKESWVKDKYPNLEIIYKADAAGSTMTTLLDAGEKANTVDLFFGGGMIRYQGENSLGEAIMCDLTESVYGQTVPGEDITVYEKIDPAYLDRLRYYKKGEDSNSDVPFMAYVYPWVKGMDSIMYNADYLRQINMEVPLTTDQLIETCEYVVKNKPFGYNKEKDGAYAILTDGVGRYWYNLYPIWWAQYEGMEAYYDFYNGVVKNGNSKMVSADIYRQKGKLYSLQVLEKLLDWDNGYLYQKRTGLEFMQSQANFIRGSGLFYSNGDWFAKEMEQTVKDAEELEGVKYDIRMMTLPIVSEIIQQTPSIPDEETLRAVIRCIDAGNATCQEAQMNDVENGAILKAAGVKESDYARILEARGYVGAAAGGSGAFVPTYAKGKEIAFDFLRFMSTDKAQEIYMENTGGASLPIEYDVRRKNPDLYEKLLPIQKDRLHMEYDAVYTTKVIPDPDNFPLVQYGQMSAVKSLGTTNIIDYFAAKGATGTALKLYNDDIAYYITAGNFNDCLERAGLK